MAVLTAAERFGSAELLLFVEWGAKITKGAIDGAQVTIGVATETDQGICLGLARRCSRSRKPSTEGMNIYRVCALCSCLAVASQPAKQSASQACHGTIP